MIKAVLAALCAATVATPAAAAVASPTVQSPTPAGLFAAVSVVSPSGVWAVGSRPRASDANATTPLIEHWNGRAWSVTRSPAPGYSGAMTAVTARSASDVWAVGNFADAAGTHSTPFAVHWNGHSWRRVALPKIVNPASYLTSVTAITADNVWAVGDTGDTVLTEHWNGQRWRTVAITDPRGSVTAALYGVSSIRGSVWAVGEYRDSSGTVHPLTERRVRNAWTIVPAADPPGSTYALFWNVKTLSANDAWATGFSNDARGVSHTLIERWDGRRWHVVSSPDAPTTGDGFSELYAIDATSASNAWAVGTSFDGKSNDNSLIEHWNGHKWTIVPSPNRGSQGAYDLLFAVSARNANDVWTVGEWGPGGPHTAPLVEHWTGQRWHLSRVG